MSRVRLSALILASLFASCSGEKEELREDDAPTVLEKVETLGSLEFSPGFQAIKVAAGADSVETRIEVTNKGDHVVTITNLESGCACLSVEVDTKAIAPGSKAMISGTFSTGKLSGATEKMITVQTDESEVHKAFLKVRLEIAPLYEIRESMTNWEVGEEPVPKKVIFEVKRDKPIHVLKASSMRDEVTCELKTVEKGRLYELILTPESTEKTLLGIVKIETDCEIEAHANAMAYFSIQ